MQRTRVAKQYEQLTHRERLQMLLQAQARDDAAEERRLWDTCPTKEYRGPDTAFVHPYEMVSRMAMAFGHDLAFELGQLNMLKKWEQVLSPLLLLAGAEAANQYQPDETHTTRYATDFDERMAAVVPEGSRQDDAERSATIERMSAQCFPDTLKVARKVRDISARRHGGQIMGILLGLDRFSQRVIGVDARTLLRAAAPPLLRCLDEIEIDAVEPDEQRAKEIEEIAWEVWEKRALG